MIRILAIDIGNTRASFARFEDRVLVWRRDVATSHFPETARSIFSEKVDACVVSNVSKNRAFFEDWVKTRLPGKLFFMDAANYPFEIHYSPVESLGHDRLSNALAAHELFPGGAIVADLGTATHFDVIAPNGAFLGGPILAGLDTMLSALTERIPHLPEVTLDGTPADPLSQNTRDAIAAGALLCTAGGIERVVRDVCSRVDFTPALILTGGNAPTIAPYLRHDLLHRFLTLQGLAVYGEIMLRKAGWLEATA